jgi:cytochrome c oxidase assembly factor CtaG
MVLGRPGGGMLWALPQRWRGPVGAMFCTRAVTRLWRALTDPAVATLLHGAAIWIWHAPPLYDLVLTDNGVHWLQHVSFFGTALIFWWSLLRGPARERGYGPAVAYLFLTALHSGILGALLAFSRRLWYPAQTVFAGDFGLTPIEDQQLAGLIMWAPGGLVYAAAALAFAGMWISAAGLRAGAAHAGSR